MERDERRRADALDRYWDATLRGEMPARPGHLDEATALVVAQLARRPASPSLNAAQLRVRQRIVATTNASEETMHASSLNLSLPDVGPRPACSRVVSLPARRGSYRGSARLALAAAVLLALALGYVVVEPGGPSRNRAPVIPAGYSHAGSPTPAGAADELLLDIVLPAEAFPLGGPIGTGIVRNTIPPGTRSTWEPTCCPGPYVEYVISGGYTVRADAAIRLIHANGTADEVPAGTEVVLRPGDALVSRNETAVEVANTGTETVELLTWILVEDPKGMFGGHVLPSWSNFDPDTQTLISPLEGPARLRMRRIELAAGAGIPPIATGSLQFRVQLPENAAGTPVASTVGKQLDDTLYNSGSDAVTLYVVTLEPLGADATPASASPTSLRSPLNNVVARRRTE